MQIDVNGIGINVAGTGPGPAVLWRRGAAGRVMVMTLSWPRRCAVRALSLAIAGACRYWTRIRQADSPDACVRPIMLDEERERRRPGNGQRVITHRVR